MIFIKIKDILKISNNGLTKQEIIVMNNELGQNQDLGTNTSAETVAVVPVEKNGAWVKKVRKESGLTQVEFCKKVGISQGLVSQVEKGGTPLSNKFIKKIEAFLEVNSATKLS